MSESPTSDQLIRAAQRVAERCIPDNGCLIWQGAINGSGTACISVGGKVMAVSKVVWFMHHGEMPTAKLERTCRESLCVNPLHLRYRVGWSEEDRFWRLVDTEGPVHPYNPALGRCWDWAGYQDPSGYGRVTHSGAGRYAHRLSFMLASGRPLTPGLVIRHSCDRPCCVNPAHLDEGTHADNIADRDERRYGLPRDRVRKEQRYHHG